MVSRKNGEFDHQFGSKLTTYIGLAGIVNKLTYLLAQCLVRNAKEAKQDVAESDMTNT